MTDLVSAVAGKCSRVRRLSAQLVIGAIAGVLCCLLSTNHSSAEEVIRIVSSLPRTGSGNAQTTTMVNAIRMALEERQHKVGNFRVEYEDWDDATPERGAWDPNREADNARRAVQDPDVMGYIGTLNSGAAKIAMPILNQAGLVMISPANSWPGLTKPGIGEPNEPTVYRPSGKVTFFRVIPTDEIQGPAGARWAREIGVSRAFVLHDRELYGKGIAEMFRKAAPGLGLEIVGFEGVDSRASNYRALVTKIRQANPGLVYFGGITQSNAGQLAKDLRSGGVKATYMVPDGCFEKAFIESAGKANVEGSTYITFSGIPPRQLTGGGKEFFDRYKHRFGAEPEAYAVYTYEAAQVLLSAIEKVNQKDRWKIVEAVANTRDFDGALGRWSFDKNGDTTQRTLSINEIKNGEFSFVKSIE